MDLSVSGYEATPYDFLGEAFLNYACSQATFNTGKSSNLLGIPCSNLAKFKKDQVIYEVYYVSDNAMYIGSLTSSKKDSEKNRPQAVDLSLHFNKSE